MKAAVLTMKAHLGYMVIHDTNKKLNFTLYIYMTYRIVFFFVEIRFLFRPNWIKFDIWIIVQ